MADIAETAAKIAVVYPEIAEIINVVSAEAITAGEALYQTVSGTFGLAQADEIAKRQFRGVALEAVGSGDTLSMMKRGFISGYALATYEDEIYLSDTPGSFDTTPGSLLVKCGRVMSLADPGLSEVLYVEADWLREWGSAGEVP